MRDFEAESGKRIRNLREKNGYSREKLSELAGIGVKFLYEIECRKKGMSAYTLYNLANALNVSCDYILTGNTKNSDAEHILTTLSKLDSQALSHISQIIHHATELYKKQ